MILLLNKYFLLSVDLHSSGKKEKVSTLILRGF